MVSIFNEGNNDWGDTIGSARPIQFNTFYRGTASRTDEDWFSINVPDTSSVGWHVLVVDAATFSGDFDFYDEDDDGFGLTYDISTSFVIDEFDNQRFRMNVEGDGSATIYFRYDPNIETGEYTFGIFTRDFYENSLTDTERNLPDDHADDENREDATPYTVGTTASGIIHQSQEEDYFRVTLQPGEYTINMNSIGPALPFADQTSMRFSVHKVSNNDLVQTELVIYRFGRSESESFTIEQAGDYYVVVEGNSSGYGDQYSFSITAPGAQQPSPSPDPNPDPSPVDDFDIDNTNTDASISIGETIGGSIGQSGDTDWFEVFLTRNSTYEIDLVGQTLSNPFLELRDGDGNVIAFDDDDRGNLDSLLRVTPEDSGSYYIVASGVSNNTGTYQLSIQTVAGGTPSPDPEPDPQPGDDFQIDGIDTDGSIGAGGRVEGSIEEAGDKDWFEIFLIAGRSYQFDLVGNTLFDTFVELRDSNGELVESDDDSGEGLNSVITFTPEASGFFYVVAGGFGTNTGTYQLSAQIGDSIVPTPSPSPQPDPSPDTDTDPSPSPDDDETDSPASGRQTLSSEQGDAQQSVSTSATVEGNGQFNGGLADPADRDWISVDLQAGVTYEFELNGRSRSFGSLDDPFLVLRDPNGSFLDQNDNTYRGANSRIEFTPSISGTYYLEARTLEAEGGTYTLISREVVAEGIDDAPDNGATTIVVPVGGSVIGEISEDGDPVNAGTRDIDWYQVNLVAGRTYLVNLDGGDTAQGSLADPFLVLRNSDGQFVDQDDDGGIGLNSNLTFSPAESGTYYLVADNFTSESGSYRLSVQEVVDEGGVDAANNASTGYTIDPGEAFLGTLDSASDQDRIGVDLIAGETYTFDLTRVEVGDDRLVDPFLVLRDPTGSFIAQDDDSGQGLASRITFMATESGTHYLHVADFDNDGGSAYLLSASIGEGAVITTSSTQLSSRSALQQNENAQVARDEAYSSSPGSDELILIDVASIS